MTQKLTSIFLDDETIEVFEEQIGKDATYWFINWSNLYIPVIGAAWALERNVNLEAVLDSFEGALAEEFMEFVSDAFVEWMDTYELFED